MRNPRTLLLSSAAPALALALLLVLALSLVPSPARSDPAHAISQHKAPSPSTPPDLASRWSREDASLHAYVASSIPDVLEHTGSEAFDAHLKGVQAILRGWGAPKRVSDAGLFHSIYGTEGFQGFSLPLSERDAISLKKYLPCHRRQSCSLRGLIGREAEKLCWIFCMVDRYTVDRTIFDWKPDDATNHGPEKHYTFLSRPELGRFPIRLTKDEWVDFVELTLADWLEQVQGAAETSSEIFRWKVGEAYAYRRKAYAKMVEVLSGERPDRLADAARRTHADVYGTEGEETRRLVQTRTPPMSDAARSAWDALRSAGEDVPGSFAPMSDGDGGCDAADEEGAPGLAEIATGEGREISERNAYETEDLLSMYLGLHFPLSGSNVLPIVDHADAPVHGLRFPQRVVELLVALEPVRTNGRALDVGCAVGGASFELAKSFDHVEAFDFSENFIATAKRIQSGEALRFNVPVEGDIAEEASVVLEPGVDASAMGRVHFFRGDACALADYADGKRGFGTFDGVVMANLLCRLPDPSSAIRALPEIVNEGGVVVIVTPFTWLEEFTPRNKWLGGFHDPASQTPVYSKDKLKEIMESVGFAKIHEEQMPLVIREHRRKYQYIVSEATGWRKER